MLSDIHFNKNSNYSITLFELLSIIGFLVLIVSTLLMQFIPIQTSNWFHLGMGKYVGITSIFAIYCIIMKKYLPAFFVCIFSSFFVFHELIIFYDNYAIELGKELGSDGTFRLVFDIFKDAFKFKYGFFWASISSLTTLLLVFISWFINVYKGNYDFQLENNKK